MRAFILRSETIQYVVDLHRTPNGLASAVSQKREIDRAADQQKALSP